MTPQHPKKVAILQSSYIPWKGYFDIINMADEFILYDNIQYTRRDWRNRNKIKTPQGSQWITIPIHVKGKYHQAIRDTTVIDNKWRKKHWLSLLHNYAKAKYFKAYKALFEPLYLNNTESFLSEINYAFIKTINKILGITTKISWATHYDSLEDKNTRLINMCKAACATDYISGHLAKNYLDESLFQQAEISIQWMDYANYPIYQQLHGAFEHEVTILDLIFNEGPNALKYMKSFGNK